MISQSRNHRGAALIAAYLVLACIGAFGWVNVFSPTSVALGADWQCSRLLLVLTTCTPPPAPDTVAAADAR